MKFHRVVALARKETLHVLRDPRSLGLGIAIPVLLILLFGYALTLDVDRVPTLVWDQDESPLSRKYVSHLQGSRYFSVKGHTAGYDSIRRGIDDGSTLLGIVIPSDFSTQLRRGENPSVQALIEGSDANTAGITKGYVRSVNQQFNRNLLKPTFGRSSVDLERIIIQVKTRVWYNPSLESKNYIVPGLIAVIMMVIAALLTSLTVAREWESGTMEPLLATPVKPTELVIGKLTPYFVIGLIDVSISVLMGEFIFGIPLRGSVLFLFGASTLFLVGALSLGLLISILAMDQLLASQLAMVVTFLPSFLLSGFMYDIDSMPVVVQWLTHLIPARYFVFILKGIYLKGATPLQLQVELLLLAVFSAVVLGLSIKMFRKRLT